MQLKTLLLGFALALLPVSVTAGSGHDHGHSHSTAPVNQATAKANALEIVASLVKRNKLDNSWGSITASSVEKKTFGDHSEWLAIFVNDKITDSAKRTLYIFLSLDGAYIAANHSGK